MPIFDSYEDYIDEGGWRDFQEQNIDWLSDDYDQEETTETFDQYCKRIFEQRGNYEI